LKKRPQRAQSGRPARKEGDGDDPWSPFWERLIVDWVAVAVLGFGVQGLWFGLTALWVGQDPDIKPTLVGLSSRLGWPWMIAILGGFVWGVRRAWSARQEPARRR
jgi:hypothetical protein